MAVPVTPATAVITVELIISIIAVIISILSFFWGVIKYGIGLETRLARLETKTELWWDTVTDTMKGVIKQPIHFRKDLLVDKGVHNMTDSELRELRSIIDSELPELLEKKDPKIAQYAVVKARIEVELYDRTCGCNAVGFFRSLFGCKKQKRSLIT